MINILVVSYSKEKRTKVAINKFGIFTTKLALTLSCPGTNKRDRIQEKNYNSRKGRRKRRQLRRKYSRPEDERIHKRKKCFGQVK